MKHTFRVTITLCLFLAVALCATIAQANSIPEEILQMAPVWEWKLADEGNLVDWQTDSGAKLLVHVAVVQKRGGVSSSWTHLQGVLHNGRFVGFEAFEMWNSIELGTKYKQIFAYFDEGYLPWRGNAPDSPVYIGRWTKIKIHPAFDK